MCRIPNPSLVPNTNGADRRAILRILQSSNVRIGGDLAEQYTQSSTLAITIIGSCSSV